MNLDQRKVLDYQADESKLSAQEKNVYRTLKLLASKMTTDEWMNFVWDLKNDKDFELPAMKLTGSEQELLKAGSLSVQSIACL